MAGRSLATLWRVAEAIRHALAVPEEARRAMGQRARAFVAANYSVGELQRQTLAVYDRLLGTRLAERFVGTLAP